MDKLDNNTKKIQPNEHGQNNINNGGEFSSNSYINDEDWDIEDESEGMIGCRAVKNKTKSVSLGYCEETEISQNLQEVLKESLNTSINDKNDEPLNKFKNHSNKNNNSTRTNQKWVHDMYDPNQRKRNSYKGQSRNDTKPSRLYEQTNDSSHKDIRTNVKTTTVSAYGGLPDQSVESINKDSLVDKCENLSLKNKDLIITVVDITPKKSDSSTTPTYSDSKRDTIKVQPERAPTRMEKPYEHLRQKGNKGYDNSRSYSPHGSSRNRHNNNNHRSRQKHNQQNTAPPVQYNYPYYPQTPVMYNSDQSYNYQYYPPNYGFMPYRDMSQYPYPYDPYTNDGGTTNYSSPDSSTKHMGLPSPYYFNPYQGMMWPPGGT